MQLDWQQAAGFVAFVVMVLAVFLGAIVVVIERTWQLQVDRRKGDKSTPLSWFRKSVVAAAAVGLCCIAYGVFVEPFRLTVTKLTISSEKLPVGTRIRLVHLSDLHSDPELRCEGDLPALVAAQKPDLICFTGDAINSPEGLNNFKTCMKALSAVAPTYAVRGNWDVWYWNKIDLFGDTGVRELRSDIAKQTIRGTHIWIGGEGIKDGKPVFDVMKPAPPDAYRIFLFHFPEYIEEMRRCGVDLYLAGHTHGGQIALPFYGAIITLSPAGKKYEAGHYQSGDSHLYVNRGIGMEGGRAPRIRFCAPPEVTVIDVVGARTVGQQQGR